MATAKEALDEPLKECKGPDGFYGQVGLIKQSGRALIERAVQAEPAYQPGYEKSKAGGKETENRLNGAPIKTLRADQGPAGIEVPRGRSGGRGPQTAPKHQRERRGFDGRILSMHGPGLSTKADTGKPQRNL